MRFKIKPEIELGTLRIKRRFALFPIDIKDECIWLEHFYSLEKYANTKYANGFKERWSAIGWSLDPNFWNHIL